MRIRPRLLAVPLVVIALGSSACGDDAVTKQEFLDHAIEFSTAAKTTEQKATMRRIFECVWPEIQKDQQLLGDFMDANESNPALSAEVSKLMVPCVTAAAKDGLTTTTTAPG